MFWNSHSNLCYINNLAKKFFLLIFSYFVTELVSGWSSLSTIVQGECSVSQRRRIQRVHLNSWTNYSTLTLKDMYGTKRIIPFHVKDLRQSGKFSLFKVFPVCKVFAIKVATRPNFQRPLTGRLFWLREVLKILRDSLQLFWL